MILQKDFYNRPVLEVAKDLLGQRLVRSFGGFRAAGIILEVEAYDGEQDQACHARSGKTSRNAAMYGPAGHAYVYFTYGMHWMLNCVCGESGYPAAVLIRAFYPVEGLDIIRENRQNVKQSLWCNGPAKLTVALGITGEFNGQNLCENGSNLMIEKTLKIPDSKICSKPRIGIQNTPEPWRSKPWRFVADASSILVQYI